MGKGKKEKENVDRERGENQKNLARDYHCWRKETREGRRKGDVARRGVSGGEEKERFVRKGRQRERGGTEFSEGDDHYCLKRTREGRRKETYRKKSCSTWERKEEPDN